MVCDSLKNLVDGDFLVPQVYGIHKRIIDAYIVFLAEFLESFGSIADIGRLEG